ncbi:vanin-like protein 1 [Anastrepha obliqua]|uniref:vanin-like protein 1 n=1 Tax=Anastrepha obliqua TaxID=95512 RepID=UPI002409D8A6|nr:vanin-like protein 1 [Anastrepha obliqua]XP_054729672.1 vanin-like protein 1 [Anastrepha obliqua]
MCKVQNFCRILVFVAAALGPQPTWQLSLPTDSTYHAGIVELTAAPGKGSAKAGDTLPRMKSIIESNSTNDLDILVFPEYVLNDHHFRTFVPDPALKIAPCEIPNYDIFLIELSCAARSRKLYLVINLTEKVFCANDTTAVGRCDPSGLNTYNTNVVFDRQGRVISRYRKSHLYGYEWYSTNVLPQPQLATFTTDFGVTFGHFICFDMLYWNPAEVLVRESGITDIIYPTYWFNELPFLTAVQLQEGWAFANDVNLLAADASKPSGQTSGSGIYAGRLGRLEAVIYEQATTQLLTARVPKRAYRDSYQAPPIVQPIFVPQVTTPRLTKLELLRDYNVDMFKTQLLAADFTAINQTLCYDSQFCCHFQAARTLVSSSTTHAAYRYRLAAYSGSHATHQRVDPAALKICAVLACTNNQLYSCGHIFPTNVTVANKYYFNVLKVSASFAHAPRRLIMPSSVDGAMLPLPVHTYEWQEFESNNATAISISLTYPKLDILTFGIWGNYYTEEMSSHNFDPVWQPTQEINSAASFVCALPLLASLVLVIFIKQF